MISIDDKVKCLLDVSVTNKPDSAFSEDVPIARRVIVNGYYPYDLDASLRVGIEIKVTHQDTVSYHQPYSKPFTTFKSTYPKSSTGIKQLENFKRFIDFIIGQEAYIVYTKRMRHYATSTTLHMILPAQIDIVTPNQMDILPLVQTDISGLAQEDILTRVLYVKGSIFGNVLLPYLVKNSNYR